MNYLESQNPGISEKNLVTTNLETAVGSACIVRSIDLSGVSGKIAVTLLVIRFFPDMPGESIGCASCVLLTAVSRIKVLAKKKQKKSATPSNFTL
jgi:hypothetical protein